LGKIETCNSTNFKHSLCIENKNKKRLKWMHFEIDIEFTKFLGQFKQKPFCKFIHDMKNSSIFLTF
jgi:hypothetical protein